MPYSILSTRVSGISIPIEDSDALNTVTKLIRQSTKTERALGRVRNRLPAVTAGSRVDP